MSASEPKPPRNPFQAFHRRHGDCQKERGPLKICGEYSRLMRVRPALATRRDPELLAIVPRYVPGPAEQWAFGRPAMRRISPPATEAFACKRLRRGPPTPRL